MIDINQVPLQESFSAYLVKDTYPSYHRYDNACGICGPMVIHESQGAPTCCKVVGEGHAGRYVASQVMYIIGLPPWLFYHCPICGRKIKHPSYELWEKGQN